MSIHKTGSPKKQTIESEKNALIKAITQKYRLRLIEESIADYELNEAGQYNRPSFNQLIEIAKAPKQGNPTKELKIRGIQYFVEYVLQKTPEEFYNEFSKEDIKRYSLDKLIYALYEKGKESMYRAIPKDSIFNMIWPDKFSYDQNNKSHQLFFCTDEVIEEFCSIIQLDKEFEKKDIEQLIKNAIDGVIYGELNLSSSEEVFDYLANQSAMYYGKNPNAAGINSIIDTLHNICILDFYFLSTPKEYQCKNYHQYYAVRKKISSIVPIRKWLEEHIKDLSKHIHK